MKIKFIFWMYNITMSIVHLINKPSGERPYNVDMKSINGHNVINLNATPFVSTPATPLNKQINGFLYLGTTTYGKQPTTVTFYGYFNGGILGQCDINIVSQNIASPTVYYTAVLPVDGTGVFSVNLSQSLALPNSITPMYITITSDATANSTFTPLAIDFIYN